MPYHPSLFGTQMIAQRLGLSVEDPALPFTAEQDSVARRLADRFPQIGTLPSSWDSLSPTDRQWFDEAVALLTAARMLSSVTTGGTNGDLAQMRTEDGGAMQVAAVAGGERAAWLAEAAQAVGRVSVVAAAFNAAAAAFRPFRVSGPTRTGRNAGALDTIMASIVRLFTDDWYAEADYGGVASDYGLDYLQP